MKRLNIKISDETKQWLESESKKTAIPQNAIVTMALEEYKRNKLKNAV